MAEKRTSGGLRIEEPSPNDPIWRARRTQLNKKVRPDENTVQAHRYRPFGCSEMVEELYHEMQSNGDGISLGTFK